MKITKEHIGKKARIGSFKEDDWIKVLDVGDFEFWGEDKEGLKMSCARYSDWHILEEECEHEWGKPTGNADPESEMCQRCYLTRNKPKTILAPALVKIKKNRVYSTVTYEKWINFEGPFISKEDVRQYVKGTYTETRQEEILEIIWPAPQPNEDGYYEIEEEV